jgi:hypothetical protein
VIKYFKNGYRHKSSHKYENRHLKNSGRFLKCICTFILQEVYLLGSVLNLVLLGRQLQFSFVSKTKTSRGAYQFYLSFTNRICCHIIYDFASLTGKKWCFSVAFICRILIMSLMIFFICMRAILIYFCMNCLLMYFREIFKKRTIKYFPKIKSRVTKIKKLNGINY